MDVYAFMIKEGTMSGDIAILHIADGEVSLDVTVLDEDNNMVARGTPEQLLRLGHITPNDLAGARVRKEPPKVLSK